MTNERVREAMTPAPTTIDASEDVVEAARLMAAQDVGSLPVVDDGELVGMVTDRDLVRAGSRQGPRSTQDDRRRASAPRTRRRRAGGLARRGASAHGARAGSAPAGGRGSPARRDPRPGGRLACRGGRGDGPYGRGDLGGLISPGAVALRAWPGSERRQDRQPYVVTAPTRLDAVGEPAQDEVEPLVGLRVRREAGPRRPRRARPRASISTDASSARRRRRACSAPRAGGRPCARTAGRGASRRRRARGSERRGNDAFEGNGEKRSCRSFGSASLDDLAANHRLHSSPVGDVATSRSSRHARRLRRGASRGRARPGDRGRVRRDAPVDRGDPSLVVDLSDCTFSTRPACGRSRGRARRHPASRIVATDPGILRVLEITTLDTMRAGSRLARRRALARAVGQRGERLVARLV